MRRIGGRPGRTHDGVVIALRSNIRWCSDHFELACRNGEIVRVLFAIDACDREVMVWLATSVGISGEMVRDLMVACVERQFGISKAAHPVEWLSDNGSAYIAKDTLDTATALGLKLCFTPVRRRGLAAGLTAAGFGAGAAATVIPIRNVILGYGYKSAFLWFGLGQGLIVLALSQLLRAPQPGETPKPATRLTQSLREYAPLDMLKSSVFWLLYVMFVLVAGSGLMATAQIAPIAADFKLADREVTILFVTATTLSGALVFDNILNGLARPFFGWISDIIGRENTMAIVFSLGALAYWGLGEFGHTPYMFIIMTGFIFFTWGEIFSLFPATCADTFGAKYAQLMPGCSTQRKAQRPGSCR